MSGGSMDYLSYKVEEAQFEKNTPLRKIFSEHLTLVAKALHAIEWEDSGDTGPGAADQAIRAALGPTRELEGLIRYARCLNTNITTTLNLIDLEGKLKS